MQSYKDLEINTLNQHYFPLNKIIRKKNFEIEVKIIRF